MAFTGAEKAAIRQYLGVSELFRDVDSRLEGQFDTVGTIRPDAEARVRALLTRLAAIDTRIEVILDGGVDIVKADDAEFDPEKAIALLQNTGRSYIAQVAIVFEYEVTRDYYGAPAGFGGGPIALG
jgi:hypothetical protein